MTRSRWRFARRALALFTLLPLSSAGCSQGFQSAQALESAGRAPSHCAKACEDLGLRMSAFVLVEKDAAACVCEPKPAASPGAAPVPEIPAPAPAPSPAPAPAPASEPLAPPAEESPHSSLGNTATGAAAGYIVLARRREQQRSNQPTR